MSASDDVIATLSSRVSELSKRVATLATELESAQKRIAIYEEHDATIQEALSGALKAAYTIRERSETTAAQILDQAREERRLLLKEIERLRDERDSLQNDIADQRRSGIQAVAPRPLTSDVAVNELRAVASEALRGLFREIVEDLRAAPRVETPAPQTEPRRVSATEVEEEAPAPAAAAPAPAAPAPEAPAPEAPAPEAPDVATAEDVETAPSAAGELSQPPALEVSQPPALELVSSREAEEIAPPRVETTAPATDIEVVLSPIPSFPRLVEVERQIQALPAVRTLYVRDFRAGVATLAVALRSAMAPDEFAAMLTGLSEPRMRVVSSARNSLELRIDGTASIA